MVVNMRIFVIATVVALVGNHQANAQQGLNNLWMGGYSSDNGRPWGGTNIEFISGAVDTSYVNREMDYYRTSANISSVSGTFLMSTNGYYLADAFGDTMMNGSGLNPSNYTSLYGALLIPQADLLLPAPERDSKYYLFHGTVDDQAGPNANYLYLSVIDASLNNGLGEVIVKNQILIDDQLQYGRITATRHANGRDWWVFCHKLNSNTFYRLLITPEGVGTPETQDIGIYRPADGGQVCFSPDGSKFAYYWGIEDLDVFDFDRCTGLLSNHVHVDIDDGNAIGGVAFSPNSQFVYVSSYYDVYQFDAQAPDLEASIVHIAHWDSTYSPSYPFAPFFDIAQLAPDGKIYIATGNSTFHLHVINSPDQQGMASDLVQHAMTLPTYFVNSLPNHPNYHLGPIDGSVCDSLGLNVDGPQGQDEVEVRVYPNPSNGEFTVQYPAHAASGVLVVYDAAGREVLQEYLPAWSTIHSLDLSNSAVGHYSGTLRWGVGTVTVRLTIAP